MICFHDKNSYIIKEYRNKVFNEDVLTVLKRIPNDSLDMVYGDPDYNVGINYSGKNYTQKWNNYIDWHIELTKDQPEYQSLPALKFDSECGDEVISCWKLSFRERLKILISGRIWLSLMSFNKPLTPSYLSVNRKDVYSHTDDLMKWYKKLFLTIMEKLKIWK